MDKILINNQIVSMRKFVKQAKTYVINKLVKDVKQFKTKKGTDAQLEKYKRKAEKKLSEIEIIKKVLPDFISKLVLTKEKDWKSVLLDKSSSLEDRCIAMLADFEVVQTEVSKFHQANPNVVTRIPRLIKEWERKKELENDRNPQRRITASEIRQRKRDMLRNGKKVSRRNTKDNPNSGNDDKNFRVENPHAESSAGTFENESSNYAKTTECEDAGLSGNESNSEVTSEPAHEMQQKKVSAETVKYESYSGAKTSENEDARLSANESKAQVTSEPADEIQKKKVCLKTIKTLKLDELSELDKIPIEMDDSVNAKDIDPSTTKTKKDPFFLGENGEEMSGDEFIMRDDDQRSQRPFNAGNRFLNKFHNQTHMQERFQTSTRERFQTNTRERFPAKFKDDKSETFGKFKDANDFKQFDPRKFQSNKQESQTSNVNQRNLSNRGKFVKRQFDAKDEKPLHPSWEAKRKLRESESSRPAVQAKRFVFTD